MRTRVIALIVICAGLARAEERGVVKLNSVRLYLPDAQMEERVGDVGPLANYLKALQREAAAFWNGSPRTAAKGVIVAVGVRPGGKVRVWCDAVGGDVPADTLEKLRAALEQVQPVAVKGGSIAFALELGLWDQMPSEFPVMPEAWTAAIRNTKEPLLVPDGLFKVVWPE
jgi:hypothetical protein